MKNNDTEQAFPMNSHEMSFLVDGLHQYFKYIKRCREDPEYKSMMLWTALKACKKLEAWLKELKWSTGMLASIDALAYDMRVERKKQYKKMSKLYPKLYPKENIAKL